jgi:hypothetical protein
LLRYATRHDTTSLKEHPKRNLCRSTAESSRPP